MSESYRKIKNPLLSAAGTDSPFENYADNTILMPVTPVTPAVLRDDYVSDVLTTKSESSQINPPSVPIGAATHEASESSHSSERLNASVEDPSKKQGYFTSLLSSLPNLSLSSGKSETPREIGYTQSSFGQFAPETAPYPAGPPPLSTSAKFYDPQGVGGPSKSAADLQQPAPPPPPPVAFPPVGGAPASYRLGNQRRLKYAPPPDLTSNTTRKPQVPGYPELPTPNLTSFLNPNAPVENPSPSTTSAIYHTPYQSTPGQTIHTSPVQQHAFDASIPQRPNYHDRSVPPRSSSSQFPSTAPQLIPSQLPEPATPQNTPANLSYFSSFAGHQPPGIIPSSENKKQEFSSVKSVEVESAEKPQEKQPGDAFHDDLASDSIFTPISAAEVSEKLENLLLKERTEDSTRSSVDFSSEVAEITSRIDDKNDDDNLAEIDLTQNEPTKAPSVPCEVNIFSEANTATSENSFWQQPKIDNVRSSFANYQGAVNSQTEHPSFSEPSKPSTDFLSSDLLSSNFFYEPAGNNQLHSTGLNPLHGAAVQQQQQPMFYNPTQFETKTIQPLPEQNIDFGGRTSSNVPAGDSETTRNPSNLTFPSIFMATAAPESTGSATVNPVQLSANPLTSFGRSTPETVPPSLQNLASGPSTDRRMQYRSVYQHWFYRKEVESKIVWFPFSMQDSLNLEEAHNSNDIAPELKVPTDGGRYDVNILRRQRAPVYWSGPSNEVRRCSWFYKGPADSRYVPYEENVAARLEDEYKNGCLTNNWNRRIDLSNGEYIMFHSSNVQVHYLQAGSPELGVSWGNSGGSEDSTYLQGSTSRPKVVKRGVDEFNIDEGEPEKVDHLLFLVHGIGSVCDLKFRTVEEVVDEFRSISLQLVQSHYRTASEHGTVNRIEVLPISWHTTLHSDETGIDKKLKAITLESIPKLRHFTNDTLLDILFYTSPIYCQTIMQTVGNEMNRLFSLFKERNPGFNGEVYLGGHSLGSLIVFDLLCHQTAPTRSNNKEEQTVDDEKAEKSEEEHVGPIKPSPAPVLKRKLSKKISYVMGAAGTGQPYINYPALNFHPRAFFAFGSPIGMFVTVRGIDTLGEDFSLPTCPNFFNIFHPFDPVAYRVESLINPDAHKYRPMLIPHHKGRKRMHLELKETMARVGADLKQKLLDSVRCTWNSVYQLAMFHKTDNQALEREIDKVMEEQLQQSPEAVTENQDSDERESDIKVGRLNAGRRIDYVLQEAPFEYINEYIFALTSHVCYWESEDTMLMILKEIYGSMGIQTDAQLPQQTLSIERATPTQSSLVSPSTSIKNDLRLSPTMSRSPNIASGVVGMDPTAPICNKPIGPPPTAGFVRKS